jgi:hypothetical protein
MKAASLARRMRPYSIRAERNTTIYHAFASAIAPIESFDPQRVRHAMELLGQNDPDELTCVYCAGAAETWDHLFPLVKDRDFSGFGHTLGNLVPCCRACNSQKGNKDWEAWARSRNLPEGRIRRLQGYVSAYHSPARTGADLRAACPDLMREFERIRAEVIGGMADADRVAAKIRQQSAAAPEPQGPNGPAA